jgi:hypothetical protein
MSDFHKFHNAQRTKLKPHGPMRKMLSDQKPAQSFGARTSLGVRRLRNDDAMAASRPVNRARDEVQVAPPSIIDRKGEQTIGTAPVNSSADVVQVTPPPAVERKGEQTIGMAPVAAADVVRVTPPPAVERKTEQTIGMAPVDTSADVVHVTPPLAVERKGEQTIGVAPVDRATDKVQAVPPANIELQAGQTVGMAPVDRAADAGQNTTPSVIERKGIPETLSVVIVMVVVVVGLGLIEFLFGRAYAERVLAFSAMRRSQCRPDYVRPVDLSSRRENQLEADPGAVSSAKSVKKALDTIEEAVAELTSSRPRRLNPSWDGHRRVARRWRSP